MGGGSDFWNLLDDCCITHASPQSVADVLRRQKLAIDLSFWLVQCETATKQVAIRDLGPEEISLRTLLHRTLRLCSTKHGAPQLAFVGDPPTPSPELALKNSTRALRYAAMTGGQKPSQQHLAILQRGSKPLIRNEGFVQKCKRTMGMLRLMGFPCIFAMGEAEALCAQLNRSGIVDACVTPDGDSLCFGARRVLKTLALGGDRKVEVTTVEAADVQRKLGLSRQELVGCMLLLGCDFTDGVKQIGSSKALKTMQQLSAAGLHPMEVLQDWMRGGSGGVIWAPDPRDGGARKPTHCGQCGLASCEFRGMRKKACERKPKALAGSVSSPDSDSQAEDGSVGADVGVGVCECSWCVSMAAFTKQAFLRRAQTRIASAHAPTAEKIMELYLRDLTSAEEARYTAALTWAKPDVAGLCDFLSSSLGFSDRRKTEIKLLPLSTRWFFSAQPECCDYVPQRILKKIKTVDRYLYKVLWRRKGDEELDANDGPSASSTQDSASQVDGGEDADLEAVGNELETEEGADFVEGCVAFTALLAEFQTKTAKLPKPEKASKKKSKDDGAMRGLQDIRMLFQEKKILNTSVPRLSDNKSDAGNQGAGSSRGDGSAGGENNPPTGSGVGGIAAKNKPENAGKGKEKKAEAGDGKGTASKPRSIAASASFQATADRHPQPQHGAGSSAGPHPTPQSVPACSGSLPASARPAGRGELVRAPDSARARAPSPATARPSNRRHATQPDQTAAARLPLVIDLSESQSSAGEVPLLDISGSSAEEPQVGEVVEILDSP